MLLKSSSTPVLGSLLSSLSETHNNNHCQYEVPNATPTSIHQKLVTKQSSLSGFRRAQSDGNLEELSNVDEFSFSNVSKKLAHKPNCFWLEPIPSLLSHLGTCQEVEDEDEEEEEEENEWAVESIEENSEFNSEPIQGA
ncbi:uncharacterized protein LOC111407836 [Olea europaea var. sylvestris]|uniref:uncharacterized protein LOC111407836 n=1 Tax=Olea europaea var. sylvestris TaxID=158386 RepID=UPI000C1D6688|nr:uncharacterized protein LOC111407836 [Olea europaea var. sylvestris]